MFTKKLKFYHVTLKNESYSGILKQSGRNVYEQVLSCFKVKKIDSLQNTAAGFKDVINIKNISRTCKGIKKK